MTTTNVNVTMTLDMIGQDATDTDWTDYQTAAHAWLTEHEGDDLDVSVRLARQDETEGCTVDGRSIPERCIDDEPAAVRARALLSEVWALWCEGKIGGAR
jgi:hypothetical protein